MQEGDCHGDILEECIGSDMSSADQSALVETEEDELTLIICLGTIIFLIIGGLAIVGIIELSKKLCKDSNRRLGGTCRGPDIAVIVRDPVSDPVVTNHQANHSTTFPLYRPKDGIKEFSEYK